MQLIDCNVLGLFGLVAVLQGALLAMSFAAALSLAQTAGKVTDTLKSSNIFGQMDPGITVFDVKSLTVSQVPLAIHYCASRVALRCSPISHPLCGQCNSESHEASTNTHVWLACRQWTSNQLAAYSPQWAAPSLTRHSMVTVDDSVVYFIGGKSL